MRFSSKSVENIGIHMFSGAFLETTVFHFRPSEASFFLGDVSCLMAVGKSKMAVGKSQMAVGKSQMVVGKSQRAPDWSAGGGWSSPVTALFTRGVII